MGARCNRSWWEHRWWCRSPQVEQHKPAADTRQRVADRRLWAGLESPASGPVEPPVGEPAGLGNGSLAADKQAVSAPAARPVDRPLVVAADKPPVAAVGRLRVADKRPESGSRSALSCTRLKISGEQPDDGPHGDCKYGFSHMFPFVDLHKSTGRFRVYSLLNHLMLLPLQAESGIV